MRVCTSNFFKVSRNFEKTMKYFQLVFIIKIAVYKIMFKLSRFRFNSTSRWDYLFSYNRHFIRAITPY